MPNSALPLPLNCTENPREASIKDNGESIFEINNKHRVQIGFPPLSQSGTNIIGYGFHW